MENFIIMEMVFLSQTKVKWQSLEYEVFLINFFWFFYALMFSKYRILKHNQIILQDYPIIFFLPRNTASVKTVTLFKPYQISIYKSIKPRVPTPTLIPFITPSLPIAQEILLSYSQPNWAPFTLAFHNLLNSLAISNTLFYLTHSRPFHPYKIPTRFFCLL